MTKKLYEKKSPDGKRTFTIRTTTTKEKIKFLIGVAVVIAIIYFIVK